MLPTCELSEIWGFVWYSPAPSMPLWQDGYTSVITQDLVCLYQPVHLSLTSTINAPSVLSSRPKNHSSRLSTKTSSCSSCSRIPILSVERHLSMPPSSCLPVLATPCHLILLWNASCEWSEGSSRIKFMRRRALLRKSSLKHGKNTKIIKGEWGIFTTTWPSFLA